MKIVFFDNPQAFRDRVWSFLGEREAENNLMLATIGGILSGIREASLLCAVEEEGRIVGAALSTPLRGIQLTRMGEEAVRLLAARLHEEGYRFPGVLGPSETALPFGQAWPACGKDGPHCRTLMRNYQLSRVEPIERAPGIMRAVRPEDRDLLLRWTIAMAEECHMTQVGLEENVRRLVEQQEAFFWWDEDRPVTMARASGTTPHGIRIGMVYTPPEFRRRGYATSLVADLSRRMLEAGHEFCFLFTDLANPISNSIYPRIGYRPVCDFAEYEFEAPAV